MRLISFTGKGHEYWRSGLPRNAWTYGVEVWTEEKKDYLPGAPIGKRYYSWAMPVHTDEGGDYITFENTTLKNILGKFYIKDITVVCAENTCKGAREVIPHVVR